MKLCFPEKILDQHLVVLGKTGAGKSSALRHVVEYLLHHKKRHRSQQGEPISMTQEVPLLTPEQEAYFDSLFEQLKKEAPILFPGLSTEVRDSLLRMQKFGAIASWIWESLGTTMFIEFTEEQPSLLEETDVTPTQSKPKKKAKGKK